MHEPPPAADELSPWRASLLRMARPCLQTGDAGKQLCVHLLGLQITSRWERKWGPRDSPCWQEGCCELGGWHL